MNTETRTLKYEQGVLKFPCGVKVEIEASKLKWYFKMFKYETNGNELVTKGKSTIPKNVAFHIKNQLT